MKTLFFVGLIILTVFIVSFIVKDYIQYQKDADESNKDAVGYTDNWEFKK